MTTMVISLQSNPAWDAERAEESVRCSLCHAVYPGRLMALVTDGVCGECRPCGREEGGDDGRTMLEHAPRTDR